MTKVFFIPFALCLFTSALLSQGVWTQKADFGGAGREGAASFVMGTKGYIGTGRSGQNPNFIYYKDFWEWDQTNNTWTQKADLPGMPRACAGSFSIGTKGYIGTGGTLKGSPPYSDFWEWDQTTNTWLQKTNFLGVNGAYGSISFAIGTKGYIGKGYASPAYDSLFEWEGDTNSISYNTWTFKAHPLTGLEDAASFTIGNKGYAFYWDKLWEWDQLSNTYTQKSNYTGIPAAGAAGFSIGTKGYIGTGLSTGSSYGKFFWEWDQPTNTWTQKPNFGGTNRAGATGFSIGTKGYIGLGFGWLGDSKDFWEFDPNGNDITETELEKSVSIYPSPSTGKFTVNSEQFRINSINIYNSSGKLVYQSALNSQKENINLSEPNGIYFLQIKTEEGNITKKVLLSK